MKHNKLGTVALVVRYDDRNPEPVLVEKFSDDHEIATFEAAVQAGANDPVATVYQLRARQAKEDEEFGNYVEDLLSQPFVRPEIQEHGVQWLKSKIRIEEFQKCEAEATQIIAEFALKVFRDDQTRREFVLAGPVAKVKIKIFLMSEKSAQSAA